jgi:hypothetical protein
MAQRCASRASKRQQRRLGARPRGLIGVAVVALGVVAAAWLARVGDDGTRVALRTAAAVGDARASSPKTNPSAAAPAGTPGAPQTPQPASQLCEARRGQYAGPLNPNHVSLVATFESTAAGVAADDEYRHGPGYRSPLASRTPTEAEAVCWFDSDGFWAPPVVMEDPARAAKVKTRIEEIVRPDGVPLVYATGRKESMSPAGIPISSAQPGVPAAPQATGAGQ